MELETINNLYTDSSRYYRLHAIQAEQYELSKRIEILLRQMSVAAEYEIPIPHNGEGLAVCGGIRAFQLHLSTKIE